MTPETKAKAKAKVDTIYVGVGYPETFRSYAGLVMKRTMLSATPSVPSF